MTMERRNSQISDYNLKEEMQYAKILLDGFYLLFFHLPAKTSLYILKTCQETGECLGRGEVVRNLEIF